MRLAEIERHVASMEELERLVGAMRSIASLRVQEGVRALASVREYGQALAEAVRDALAIVAEEPRKSTAGADRALAGWAAAGSSGLRGRRRALVVFTSEHGFVGGFNERLIDAVQADLAATDALFVLGSRGAQFAAERGHPDAWTHAMATRLASIPEIVRVLEEALYPSIARGAIAVAEIVFGRYRRGAALAVERRRLFPLALEPGAARASRPLPLHDLPAAELLERLTAAYLVAQLTEAATESFAAENSARFAAMESAHDNVGRKLETLRLDASRARQEEVTTELLDLVIGSQASAPR
jgi:F-type H+-transporting ATPase subunit gamma